MENHYSGNQDIYEIHWSDDGECVAEIVHGESNARLIAAAPEMLEALKLTPLDMHPSDELGECLCSQCAFRKAARAAIAKAEGGAK